MKLIEPFCRHCTSWHKLLCFGWIFDICFSRCLINRAPPTCPPDSHCSLNAAVSSSLPEKTNLSSLDFVDIVISANWRPGPTFEIFVGQTVTVEFVKFAIAGTHYLSGSAVKITGFWKCKLMIRVKIEGKIMYRLTGTTQNCVKLIIFHRIRRMRCQQKQMPSPDLQEHQSCNAST